MEDNFKLPNGVWHGDDGYYLVRCPKCHSENYALAVAEGICVWCGFNANKEYSEEFIKDGAKPQCENFEFCLKEGKESIEMGIRCKFWNGKSCDNKI